MYERTVVAHENSRYEVEKGQISSGIGENPD